MSDLISRKALLEALKNNGTYLLPDGADESDYIYYSEAVDLITNAPAIEQDQTVKDALEKAARLCKDKSKDYREFAESFAANICSEIEDEIRALIEE